jgi:hypothetical protein
VTGISSSGTDGEVDWHSLSDFCHPLLPARTCATLQFSGLPEMALLVDLGSETPGELAGTECSDGLGDLRDDALYVESSVAAAQDLYLADFINAPCPAIQGGCSTSPISGVGDEASLYFLPCAGGQGCGLGGVTVGGVVRIENDVFDIQSSAVSYDYPTVLGEAVAQLCPDCRLKIVAPF